MAKQAYKIINFRAATLALIDKCNIILERYEAAGYDMTLRQLYYQLVSADEIPNNQKEYDRLGSIVNDARLAGLIDWDSIVDRTRSLRGLTHWKRPSDVVNATVHNFRIDRWKNQRYRPEVWIEKDALAGVFQRVCEKLDVPLFSCRGYSSQSEMWAAGERMKGHSEGYASENGDEQIPYILHFGDHDPSGIDMSRDIQDRLAMFGVDLDFDRLALNMNQVRQFDPPPNPAKITDSRAIGYISKFGHESWELDALEPDVLAALVEGKINDLVDGDLWNESVERESDGRETLQLIADNYDAVNDFVKTIQV